MLVKVIRVIFVSLLKVYRFVKGYISKIKANTA